MIEISEDILPKDLSACHALIAELHSELAKKTFLADKLQASIEKFMRHRFGQRADRIDPNQFRLFEEEIQASLGDEPEKPAENEAFKGKKKKKHKQKRSGRNPFPAELEREHKTYDLSDEDKKCKNCGSKKKNIGLALSEQLEYIPARIKVIVHRRISYACPNECEDEMMTAKKPAQALEKSYAGPGLLAQIAVGKYHDHLPLHRQEDILKRHNINIPRSTQSFWMKGLAGFLLPLYLMMKERVKNSIKINTDDTTLSFLEKGKTKAQKGKLWVYLGDEDNKYAVFDFTPDRKQEGPLNFLENYKGFIQADAYAGYNKAFGRDKATELGCWAHARRKFTEAQKSSGLVALTAVAFIRKLYDVEDEAKTYLKNLPETLSKKEKYELFVKKCYALRQEKSIPVLKKFKTWLLDQNVLPQSDAGKAITYATNQWQALENYTLDGRLEIDNNAAERAMKHIAIGRKNYLFAGNENGGKTAAVIYTFLYTAKLLKLNPFEYLKDILTHMPACGPDELEQFLPVHWKLTQTKEKLPTQSP